MKKLIALLLAAALLLGMAGCSSNDDDVVPSAPSSNTVQPSTSQSGGLAQSMNSKFADRAGKLKVPEIVPLARSMAAEGIVLLKNDNDALPIRQSDTVAVFGRCAVDYFTVGYGSGGDVIPPYKSNLMDGLADCGVTVSKALADEYEKWCKKNKPNEGSWGNWPMSFPEMPLSDANINAAAADSSMAIVVIGRAAGEDRENRLEPGSYYLTADERDMLTRVCDRFSRVCVVMDCGNVVDMSWTADFGDRISAIVYAWQGGMESGLALADVLTGRVNPSGRLTDTIAKSYEDYPSSANFGGLDYNNYVEDIYVGYRYFETFAKDRVLYPFGYGLSYTKFDTPRVQAEVSDSGELTVTVDVKNVGDGAGKQVLQVYAELPQGKLGNPSRILVGFGKTGVIAPGDTEQLVITADMNEFAPYDDSGVTGHRSCHVWEAGEYRIYVGENVAAATKCLSYQKTELEVVEQLGEVMAVKPENAFDRMVNDSGAIAYQPVPTATKDLRAEILANLPAELPKVDGVVKFDEVLSGARTAEEFVAQMTPEQLDELTHGFGPMNYTYGVDGNAGGFGGTKMDLMALGLPAVVTTDGPSGIRVRAITSLLPCGTALASTFNTDGVRELYEYVGREMVAQGSDMLLAPGMNIHRDPLGGRNFEYFSEDPLVAGLMGAAAIEGVQSAGVSACPKHFAANNQETNRNQNDSRVSERALREIYLKCFEIAVKKARPQSIMTSYNKINGVWSHYNYELVTDVLRGEWGFDGVVITDWWMQEGVSPEFPNISNDAYRVRAQVDVLMPGDIGNRTLVSSLDDPNGITLGEAQRSALNVVNFIVRQTKLKG